MSGSRIWTATSPPATHQALGGFCSFFLKFLAQLQQMAPARDKLLLKLGVRIQILKLGHSYSSGGKA